MCKTDSYLAKLKVQSFNSDTIYSTGSTVPIII